MQDKNILFFFIVKLKNKPFKLVFRLGHSKKRKKKETITFNNKIYQKNNF